MTDKFKKVTFNETVTIVHFKQTPLDTNVCWQQVARDRMRFKRRILDVERHIGWVFAEHHRKWIYRMMHVL